MVCLPRHLFALTLALLLTLTSVGAGVARGQGSAADTLVICNGHGTTLVQVDTNGDVVEIIQLCPECIGALFAVSHLKAVACASQRVGFQSVEWSAYNARRSVPAPFFHTVPRGPPLTV